MRSKAFVATMGSLCGLLALVCLPLALRFWGVFRTRQMFNQAVDKYNAGKFEEALPLVDRCLVRMPERVKLYRLAGYMCTRLAEPDYARARDYYERMLDVAKGRDLGEAHLRLGALYLRGDKVKGGKPDLDKAIHHLEEALKADEELRDPFGLLGVAYALKGNMARAEPHLQKAWEDYVSSQGSTVGTTARLWQVAHMIRQGDLVEASSAFDELSAIAPDVPRGQYFHLLCLARAFRANEPSITSSLREFYIMGGSLVPAHLLRAHAMTIRTLAGAAWAKLGNPDKALAQYRRAYKVAPKSTLTRRNLAYALFEASEQATKAADKKRLHDESVALYEDLLADKQLKGEEREQVTVALASFAWNEGRKADAQKLIADLGTDAGPLVLRMRAAAALRTGQYKEAIGILQDALKAKPNQPDVIALLKQLQTPPEIRNLRMQRLNPYDPRPLVSVAILPRSIPVPIPAKNVTLTLDGKAVEPIFAQTECFFMPKDNLAGGKHTVEIAATDVLGVSAAKTLSFNIREDKEPPMVVGITPEPDGHATSKQPIISFRCTDLSGINPHSLSVTFVGTIAGRRRELRIVSRGVYQIDIKRSKLKIAKGTPVKLGAVAFQFSKELLPNEYTIRVGVTDVLDNRCVKNWSFRIVD